MTLAMNCTRGLQMSNDYRCLVGPLRAFLGRRTRSVHDAEDLAQEVFLRLWRNPQGAGVRSLEAFAFKAATNLVIDRSRRTHTRMMRNAVPFGDLKLPDLHGEPDRVLEATETLTTVCEVIERLPSSTREAFLRYRIEAESHAEIAAAMGISVSMVEKHVRFAMSALHGAAVL